MKCAGIVGGRGFVGRALAAALRERGWEARTISRRARPDDAAWRAWTPQDPASLAAALDGCDCAVNLAGILNSRPRRPEDFRRAHVDTTEAVVEACRRNGIRRLLHMSALNAAPDAPSEYLRTKGRGELLAHGAELATTSFRPSVIFGPGDGLLLRFAALLRFAPGVFPLACADAVFAPVYIGDVARRMADAALDEAAAGRRVPLCGPRHWTLREIVEYTAKLLRRRVRVVPLPDALARLQARVLEWAPGQPFSMDNYLSLQLDSVCPDNADLCPTALEDIAPSYVR